MSGGELPLKNKINADEQSISLFDGHEDMINEITVSQSDDEPADEVQTPSAVVEESSTPFVIEESESNEEVDDAEDEASDNGEEADEYDSDRDNSDDGDATDTAEESVAEYTAEKTSSKPTAYTEEKPRRIDSIFDFIELFIFTLAAVFIVTTFFFKYSNVVGSSMEGTLKENDKLLLTNVFYRPKQGDIVVIDDRSFKDPIIKRVIAVGGQTVKITRDAIYVDGEILVEDYVYIDSPRGVYEYNVIPCENLKDCLVDYKPGEYYVILVPDNEVFVMGDHRNNSTDSRDIGTVNEDRILGKAIYRFAPFDKAGKIE